MRTHASTKPDGTGTVATGDNGAWNERTRTDFYGLEVTLPPGETPQGLLLKLQKDPEGFTGHDPRFAAEVSWPKSRSAVRPEDDVAILVVRMNKNAPIKYIRTVDGSPDSKTSFGVVTAATDSKALGGALGYFPTNMHPVAGFRFWGLTPVKDKPGSYVLWTAGRDAATFPGAGVSGVGPALQDWTWKAMMDGARNGVLANGGTTAPKFHSVVEAQPYGLTPATVVGPTALDTRPARTIAEQAADERRAQQQRDKERRDRRALPAGRERPKPPAK